VINNLTEEVSEGNLTLGSNYMDKVKHQYQELQHFFFLSYSGTILVTCNTSFFIFFYFFSLPGNFCLFTISALKPKYRRSST